MKTAKFIKDVSENFTGTAKLFSVNPPVEDYDGNKYDYVVASGTIAMFSGAETYIFPSDENGNVISWGELDGSFRGSINCEKAIKNMGYVIS